jgi:hypothetical protein
MPTKQVPLSQHSQDILFAFMRQHRSLAAAWTSAEEHQYAGEDEAAKAYLEEHAAKALKNYEGKTDPLSQRRREQILEDLKELRSNFTGPRRAAA